MIELPLQGERDGQISSDSKECQQGAAIARALRSADSPSTFANETLARVAPWLVGVSVAGAILLFHALRGSLPTTYLATWTLLVIAASWIVLRARRAALIVAPGSEARSRALFLLEISALAALWCAPSVVALSGRAPETQILIGCVVAAMMACGFLLAVIPVAAVIWVLVLGGTLVWGVASTDLATPLIELLIVAYSGVILVGCLSLERLVGQSEKTAIQERARREEIAVLLREYEEQGVGGLWRTDTEGHFTYVSPQICQLLGRSTAQIAGQSIIAAFGADARLVKAIGATQPFSGVEIQLGSGSAARWIALSGTPLHASDKTFQGYRGVGWDATESHQAQEKLRQLANLDVLTGLPNRQRMREVLQQSINRAQEDGSHCAVLFLDLDGFKPVNDSFGHPAGDAVLKQVAHRLTSVVGQRGIVGRVGGDEFAIVCPQGENRYSVEELSGRLIEEIAKPFATPATKARIGLSIGSALAPADGNSVDDLLLKADLALYQAKSAGRGTFRHFDPLMQQNVEERLSLEADLREALGRKQFEVYYQPIVSAQTQDVTGFEALIRWNRPGHGRVPPNVFIPIAEETGLIIDIGAWVIHTACHDAMQWPEHITVSVNLSPRQIVIPALPNIVREALVSSHLAANRLELEVTESVFMSDTDGSLDVLRRVRSMGVGIALDDFGTGYSSLGYLNKTVFHTLKIDGSFVREAATSSETIAIIHAIVSLANSFRMKITAEGVETRQDFERMRELGCHRIQGYLFGKPMPFAETAQLVGTRWEHKQRAAM